MEISIVGIFFGLRVSEYEIFLFYKNIVLISTSTLLHKDILFAINSMFQLPKDCFSKYHLIYSTTLYIMQGAIDFS